MRAIGWGCVFVLAALFVVALVGAQIGCPIPRCTGPDGDAWMPAFLFAPLGIPALVASVFFVAEKLWPDSPGLTRAGLWLKYLFLAVFGLAILSLFVSGFLRGRDSAFLPSQRALTR